MSFMLSIVGFGWSSSSNSSLPRGFVISGIHITKTKHNNHVSESAIPVVSLLCFNSVFFWAGERSQFANRIKALNRLKAKLLVIAWEQGVSTVSDINKEAIVDVWQKETRKYKSHPQKLVEDLKTRIQLPGLNSVLDGNLEPLIGAHINTRQSTDKF